jgi:hypothetical protein
MSAHYEYFVLTCPFSIVFTKDRWTGIAAVKDAEQK